VKTILDAGPLVAFLNDRDEHHNWAIEMVQRLPEPLWTCEPVLAEAGHLSNQAEAILEMLASGVIRIGLELEDQTDGVLRLLRKFGPRMDLADACVVRMSEIFPDSQVFTTDRQDFSIYRRNSREVIAVLLPEP